MKNKNVKRRFLVPSKKSKWHWFCFIFMALYNALGEQYPLRQHFILGRLHLFWPGFSNAVSSTQCCFVDSWTRLLELLQNLAQYFIQTKLFTPISSHCNAFSPSRLFFYVVALKCEQVVSKATQPTATLNLWWKKQKGGEKRIRANEWKKMQ